MKASERPVAKVIDICSRIPGLREGFTSHQNKVLNRIAACRTESLGVHVYKCSNDSCDHTETRYASCKNRACSVCSWLPREKWKLQRENDLIPDTPYYHNVFTIPHEFSEMASQNQVVMQTLLFKCVSETLKAFEPTHCKGGQIGFCLVLHTWSTMLRLHYHIHAVIPGGYLLDGVWHEMNKYLFPAKGLASMFQNKFCSGLRKLYRKGRLHFHGHLSKLNDSKVFSGAVDAGYRKKWYVHTEVTKSGNPERLIGYLSNYVYKTAISHSRIDEVSETGVTFKYRSHNEDDRGQWRSTTLPCASFLEMFANHIQPHRYMRIRYYGYLGGGVKSERLKTIFEQKEHKYEARNNAIHRSSCEDIQKMSGQMECMRCPKCGSPMLSPWEQYRRRSVHDPPRNDAGDYKVCA